MSPLRLTKEEYELLDAAIGIMTKAGSSFQEKRKVLAAAFPEEDRHIWTIIMRSGDPLGYEEMAEEARARTCSNGCSATCKVSCISGCLHGCKTSCDGSCKAKCGNAYRVAAGG